MVAPPRTARRRVRLPSSLWIRATIASSIALAVALAVAVLAAYEVTSIRERGELDVTLALEGDRVAAAVVADVDTAAIDGVISERDLERIATRVLALHPGSGDHLTVVRSDDMVLSTARGPARLESLRDSGRLPLAPSGRYSTVDGVRVRSTELRFADRTVTVETLGDADALATEAATVLRRTILAAVIGGSVGLAGLALALRRSTRGLAGVSYTVRRTRLDDLTRRAPEPPGTNEVAVLARDVNSMLDELARARAARDELIASVSHELRTPLAAARGHTELLIAGRASDPPTSLGRIDRELARLNRLVDDLLALARAGDQAWLSRDLVAARDVLNELETRLPALGAGHVHVGSAPDVLIEVDVDRMLQALSNLVVNAVLHTPSGTRVIVEAGISDTEVEFRVSDDGPGIPPAVLARAGEAFVRGSSGGSGLGLAVTRAVASAHGGRLEIDSSPAGTLARLTVPLGE